MSQEATEIFPALSTMHVEYEIRDDAGNLVTPSELAWTLTDLDGTVINSRDAVSIPTPASTGVIELYGADLPNPTVGDRHQLVLLLAGLADTSESTDKPVRDQFYITVERVIADP